MKRRDEAAPVFYKLPWARWKEYRIHTDGWIYPAGPGFERYEAGKEGWLPLELARINHVWESRRHQAPQDLLNDPVTKSVVGFLRQFGFLGLTQLQDGGAPRRVTLDGVEQLADGDCFAWVLKHAHNVKVCLALAGALRTGQHDQLIGCIRYLEETRSRYFPGHPLQIPTLTEECVTLDIPTLYAASASVTEKAHALLRAYLAPNLGNVARVYDPESGRSIFQFQALLQLIYWQLADWVNGERWRQCLECHVFFCASDGRQIFCPPPTGVRESRCARRARMRASRQSLPKRTNRVWSPSAREGHRV